MLRRNVFDIRKVRNQLLKYIYLLTKNLFSRNSQNTNDVITRISFVFIYIFEWSLYSITAQEVTDEVNSIITDNIQQKHMHSVL